MTIVHGIVLDLQPDELLLEMHPADRSRVLRCAACIRNALARKPSRDAVGVRALAAVRRSVAQHSSFPWWVYEDAKLALDGRTEVEVTLEAHDAAGRRATGEQGTYIAVPVGRAASYIQPTGPVVQAGPGDTSPPERGACSPRRRHLAEEPLLRPHGPGRSRPPGRRDMRCSDSPLPPLIPAARAGGFSGSGRAS